MGQVLHLGTRTTEAARRAIQHSQARQRTLARRYGINPKTVAKSAQWDCPGNRVRSRLEQSGDF
jgi:hypothetical protein